MSNREISVAAGPALRRPDPARPRVGQRRQERLDLRRAAARASAAGYLRAELLERHVDREARAVVGDLEEDAARLAEVDRVEVVAVDDRRGVHAGALDALEPLRVLGDRRAQRDVVDRARALQPALVRRRVEAIARRGARRAAPSASVAGRLGAEQALEQRAGRVGVEAVRADGVEALERVLRGDLGMLGRQRLVGGRVDGELVTEALGVGEAQDVAVALGRDALGAETLLPEVDRLRAGRRATRSRWTMPGPARPRGAPGYSKNVMSEPARPCSSA